MSQELTLSASLGYEDAESTAFDLAIAALVVSVATKRGIHAKQSIDTSEEAINLAEVAAPGWCMFINRDDTNFVTLKVATSGAIFAKLKPGEFCILRLGSGAQAPFAVADTAACQLEYVILDT